MLFKGRVLYEFCGFVSYLPEINFQSESTIGVTMCESLQFVEVDPWDQTFLSFMNFSPCGEYDMEWQVQHTKNHPG